jgi:outer membrane protein X
MLDVNVNLHYVFTFGEFGVYPLAGVTLQNARVSGIPGGGSHSESKFGLNLGAGAEYPVTEKIKVNLEFTYKLVNDYDRSLIGLGVAYKF